MGAQNVALASDGVESAVAVVAVAAGAVLPAFCASPPDESAFAYRQRTCTSRDSQGNSMYLALLELASEAAALHRT
jgi:hypothetical protein